MGIKLANGAEKLSELELFGKVSIITGGTSGIGLETARYFIANGCKVVMIGRDPKRGESALRSLGVPEGSAMYLQADVSQAADCERVMEITIRTFGRLDILFNNAGLIHVDRTVVQTSEAEWDATMDVNVKGTFLMSKYAIPSMIANGEGSIINSSSIFGLKAGGGVAAYCAAKAAVIMLTKAMAIDHASQGIRVNCVCPGSVDTPLLKEEMDTLGGESLQRPKFAARHPMNRIAQPGEIAQAVLFLAGSRSSFITGAVLPVDGGRAAW